MTKLHEGGTDEVLPWFEGSQDGRKVAAAPEEQQGGPFGDRNVVYLALINVTILLVILQRLIQPLHIIAQGIVTILIYIT